MSDPDLYFAYMLAEHLHQTVGDILALPLAEFVGWCSYFEIKQEKRP